MRRALIWTFSSNQNAGRTNVRIRSPRRTSIIIAITTGRAFVLRHLFSRTRIGIPLFWQADIFCVFAARTSIGFRLLTASRQTQILIVSTSWTKCGLCGDRQICSHYSSRHSKMREPAIHQDMKKALRKLTSRNVLHLSLHLRQNQIRYIDDIVRADWKIRHRIQTFHFLPRFTFRGGDGLFHRPVIFIRDIGDNPFSII